ncbi:MAG TPA: alpha/beta hydrolase [Acidobacteriaceae bacterium]
MAQVFKGDIEMTKITFLEPKTQRFLDDLAARGGRKPVHTLSPADARKSLEELQFAGMDIRDLQIEERILPVGPSGAVSVSIFRPNKGGEPLPVAVYFHGGGWVLGNLKTHGRLACELARASGAAFVFVHYASAPEAQFPVANEQAYAVVRFIAEHGSALGLDGGRMAVVGDSVGGNMVAAVTLLAKERGGPQIRYQVLCYPVTDSSMTQNSYADYGTGPWLTRQAMEWYWGHYAPNVNDRKKALAAPLLATPEQLEGLPPALVLVAEHDLLRDEGEEYARKLAQAGVEVTAVRYLSTFHGFMMLDALAETPAAKGAIELVSQRLRQVLGTSAIERAPTISK